MTPAERAEKIVQCVEDCDTALRQKAREFVIAQLREVEELVSKQKYEQGLMDGTKTLEGVRKKEVELAFRQGRESMREEAAQIADKRGWVYLKDDAIGYPEGMRDGADMIAAEIRAIPLERE